MCAKLPREFLLRLSSAARYGGMLDADACYQLERGLKTLALRVRQQNDNSMRLAQYLQAHPAVARVSYPGLPEHPDHAIAARLAW